MRTKSRLYHEVSDNPRERGIIFLKDPLSHKRRCQLVGHFFPAWEHEIGGTVCSAFGGVLTSRLDLESGAGVASS